MERKFKVGDSVRVVRLLGDTSIGGDTEGIHGYIGRVGVVQKAYENVWAQDLEVKMNINEKTLCFKEDEVEGCDKSSKDIEPKRKENYFETLLKKYGRNKK